MSDANVVSNHYTQRSLLDAIQAGVEGLGKSPDTVSVDDLGPVEEFHTRFEILRDGQTPTHCGKATK